MYNAPWDAAEHVFYMSTQRKKIVAVLYEGGQVAKESPGLMTAKENALGLRELSLLKDHELIVTSDKDGPNCGAGWSPSGLIAGQKVDVTFYLLHSM